MTKRIVSPDYVIFWAFIFFLLTSIATSARLNIATDSLDYYAILQRIVAEHEKTIVGNLHFIEQRSPGYPLLSCVWYMFLTVLVEPFVHTEKVEAYSHLPRFEHNNIKTPAGSELMIIPPQPLHLKNLLFRDFYIPMEDSWFRWKLALSLFLTSVSFLFVGIWANAKVLKLYYPDRECSFIVVPILVTSYMFMRSMYDLPLFATLTAFGLSSLSFLFMCLFQHYNDIKHIFLAGLTTGFLVLTRLELSIFAVSLACYFLLAQNKRTAIFFCIGGSLAFAILIAYDLYFFGEALHRGIFRGDINVFGLDIKYIFNNFLHPKSGILFWTPFLLPGLFSLMITRDNFLKFIGVCSFVLLVLYTFRMPIMYRNISKEMIDIGGILVTMPSNYEQMLELTRFEINRYTCTLIPFSILGVRIGMEKIYGLFSRKNGLTQ